MKPEINISILEKKWPRKQNRILCLSKRSDKNNTEMYLMYYLDEKGERVYTFSKIDPAGRPTLSAHPAKFSPEDKYSRERILIKKRLEQMNVLKFITPYSIAKR